MPISITIHKPHTISNVFNQLKPNDQNLVNLDQTIRFCNSGFPSNLNIIDLLGPNVPLDLNDVAWDYQLSNGVRSLARRGFYQIIDTPFERPVGSVQTWGATVLYFPNLGYNKIYRFLANIGPLLNTYAFGFDLNPTNPSMVRGIPPTQKEAYFLEMRNKVFYIAQQERIMISANPLEYAKQTAWFKF